MRASGRLIRSGEPVVCLTDRPPPAIARLASWGRGQLRWNFEPYALAVRRREALRQGARPVLHLPADQFDGLPAGERFRFQRCEPPDCDWTAEGEWRVRGDLDLRVPPPGDLVAVVPATAAAAAVAARFSPPVMVVPHRSAPP